jgi:hypothetical protein
MCCTGSLIRVLLANCGMQTVCLLLSDAKEVADAKFACLPADLGHSVLSFYALARYSPGELCPPVGGPLSGTAGLDGQCWGSRAGTTWCS